MNEDPRVAELMAQPWAYVLTPDHKDGGFVAEVAELPGCISQGPNPNEAVERLREAQALWLEVALAEGLPIPRPQAA